MLIKLITQLQDGTLVVIKSGQTLIVNGESFDFSFMADGDRLPLSAVSSDWFRGDVTKEGGEISVSLLLPIPWESYSPELPASVDLVDVPDGRVDLPKPLPDESGIHPELPPLPATTVEGVIDQGQLITKEMKDAAAAAQRLAESRSDLSARNALAAAQIARIQDRVDTLGYGIDSGEATAEDEAELAALTVNLKAWKAYKFQLGKVATQATWPTAPVWPAAPAIPDIAADPAALAADTI